MSLFWPLFTLPVSLAQAAVIIVESLCFSCVARSVSVVLATLPACCLRWSSGPKSGSYLLLITSLFFIHCT